MDIWIRYFWTMAWKPVFLSLLSDSDIQTNTVVVKPWSRKPVKELRSQNRNLQISIVWNLSALKSQILKRTVNSIGYAVTAPGVQKTTVSTVHVPEASNLSVCVFIFMLVNTNILWNKIFHTFMYLSQSFIHTCAHHVTQLTLRQQGLEFYRSTYAWISKNTLWKCIFCSLWFFL